MADKKKPDLDLDFGDISGNKPKKKPPKKKEKKAEEPEKSGVTLTFPAGEGLSSRGFISKSLEDCTGEEFLKWARSVGYNLKDADPEKFNSHKLKMNMFNRIRMFHKKLHFAIPGAKLF